MNLPNVFGSCCLLRNWLLLCHPVLSWVKQWKADWDLELFWAGMECFFVLVSLSISWIMMNKMAFVSHLAAGHHVAVCFLCPCIRHGVCWPERKQLQKPETLALLTGATHVRWIPRGWHLLGGRVASVFTCETLLGGARWRTGGHASKPKTGPKHGLKKGIHVANGWSKEKKKE